MRTNPSSLVLMVGHPADSFTQLWIRPCFTLSSLSSPGCCVKWRNWCGFWLLGLCNNFAYVVMLSAAHDILEKQESKNSTVTVSSCNVCLQAVLLADILPTLFIKISAPFVIHKVPYGFRVLFCVAMAAASFLLVSFSSTVWLSIIGNY
uniref:Battenin n=1 Tax=Xiphophorus couchianus TaxID=32473 RepID=A0A3B5LYV8_9TELE